MPKPYIGIKQAKLFISDKKVKYVYKGGTKIYSAGNIVTYKVDESTSYTEEVDNEATCLSPTTFKPSKTGWTFLGWREDSESSSDVLSTKIMGDNPITLYAVFKQGVTLTLYNNSSSASTQSGTRYYNNSNENNPSFKLTQNTASGWSALGWCTSNGATASVTVENGGTVTLAEDATYYGKYSQTITLSYNGNGATSGSTASQTGTRYYNSGNYSNPSFTIRNNGFSRTYYKFSQWALNSASGTKYNGGNTIALSNNATMYAVWTYNPILFPGTGHSFKLVPQANYAWIRNFSVSSSTITCKLADNVGHNFLLCSVFCEQAIDITNFSTLTVDFNVTAKHNTGDGWGYCSFGFSNTLKSTNPGTSGYYPDYANTGKLTSDGRQTRSLSLSGKSGAKYFEFYCGAYDITIYSIKLS